MICLHHSARSSCPATPTAAMFSEASLISPRNQFLSEWWVCRYCSKFALNVATKERFQASPLATFIQCFGQRCAVTRDSGDSGRSKGSARPSSTSCVVFRVRLRNWVARGLETCCKQLTLSIWAFVWTPRRLSTTECATLSDFPLFVGA